MAHSDSKRSIRSPILKFLLLGDEKVGKTSLAHRFLGQKFNPLYHQTIGVNISSITIERSESTEYSLLFWDLAGSEKFQALRSMYFDGTSGVFLIVDVTHDINIESLLKWFENVDETLLKKLSVALVFNKIDLLEDKENIVEYRQNLRMKLQENLPVWSILDFETSAKTGSGVIRTLFWLIDEAIFRVDRDTDFWNSVFDANHYPFCLFKLNEFGTEVIFQEIPNLKHVESDEMPVYLIKLGIKLSVMVGQGENYSTGVSDIGEGVNGLYRLFVYSFRMKDTKVEDSRLRNNFLHFVIFIPIEMNKYFGAFSKSQNILNDFFSQIQSVQDITLEHLILLRQNILDFYFERKLK